jgi:hypothetical protein
LAFGAALFAVPAVYISFHEGFSLRKGEFTGKRTKLNRLIIYINYGLSLAILVILAVKSNIAYTPYLGENRSLISDAPVLKADWDTYFYLGLGIMAGLILGHIFQTDPLKDKVWDRRKELGVLSIIAFAAIFETYLLSRILVSRVQTLATPT